MDYLTLLEIREKYGRDIPIILSRAKEGVDCFYIRFNKDHDGYHECWANFSLDQFISYDRAVGIYSLGDRFYVLDWLENTEAVSNNGVCKCNIISLMQNGCNCGAISRYVAPSLG
jgi:hypothetical protein